MLFRRIFNPKCREHDIIENYQSDSDFGNNKKIDLLIEQYHVLSANRISHDEMLWEVPIMFFTGQAFMFTIALGVENNHLWWARALAALISAVFGLLSIQVFERDRVMVVADTEQMLDIEQYLSSTGFEGLLVNESLDLRRYMNKQLLVDRLESKNRRTFLNRAGSPSLWKTGMYLTTVISIITFLCNIAPAMNSPVFHFIHWPNDLIGFLLLWVGIDTFLHIIQNIATAQIKTRSRRILNFLLFTSLILRNEFLVIFFLVPLLNSSSINIVGALTVTCMLNTYSIYRATGQIHAKVQKILKRRLYKNTANHNCQVCSIVLAGGYSSRLVNEHVIQSMHPKFLSIRQYQTSLLDATLKRANSFVTNQFLISTKDIYVNHKRSMDISANRNKGTIITEPDNRGTAIAIMLSTIKIHQELTRKNSDIDPVIIVTPSDHVIIDELSFTHSIKTGIDTATLFNKLYIFGIPPVYASTELGYFELSPYCPNTTCGLVVDFHEKPRANEAEELLKNHNIYWNCGIFVARLSVFEECFATYLPTIYSDLRSCADPAFSIVYKDIDVYSFDRDILIKAVHDGKVRGIKAFFDWVDVGIPETLERLIIEQICSVDQSMIEHHHPSLF